jgi:hypothetical protein
MKRHGKIYAILIIVFLCSLTGQGWTMERKQTAFSVSEGDILIIDLRKIKNDCLWEKTCCSLAHFSTGDVTLIDLSSASGTGGGLSHKPYDVKAVLDGGRRAGGFQVVLIDAEPSLFFVNRQYSAIHQPLPKSGVHYLPMVQEIAGKYGIDPQLILCIIEVESGFNPFACSPQKAMGLMQIIPETAQSLNLNDPFDPYENIKAGVKYLCLQLNRFGSIELALAAYNAGPGAVEAHGGIPPYRETQDYVRTILDRYYHGGVIP